MIVLVRNYPDTVSQMCHVRRERGRGSDHIPLWVDDTT